MTAMPPWVAELDDRIICFTATGPAGAAALLDARELQLGTLDQVTRLAARAVRMAEGCPPACRHVLAGLPAWQGSPRLCAQHPAAGLHCHPCMAAHIDRHDWATEHTCDQCGRQVPAICSGALPLPIRRAHVRGLDGRRRQVPGPVMLGGLGVCARCETAARRRGRSR
jgi:hypothetical protein